MEWSKVCRRHRGTGRKPVASTDHTHERGATDDPRRGREPPPLCDQAKFAMANGTAPLEASSWRIVQHRLSRGGNGRLNRAIHTGALTEIARPDTESCRYYQKLIPRGEEQPGSHTGSQTADLRPESGVSSPVGFMFPPAQ